MEIIKPKTNTMAKEIKKVGRPKLQNSKDVRFEIRFSEDEIKAIDSYAKKHNFDSRASLIRQAIKEKISQLDAFRDV